MKHPMKGRVPKPGNPYVALVPQRHAGEQAKCVGAKRQAEKQALKKALAMQ